MHGQRIENGCLARRTSFNHLFNSSFQNLFEIRRCFSITGHNIEGLGIAANVIAVVDLAVKTGGVIGDYIKSAKGCTETTTQLHKELEAVK